MYYGTPVTLGCSVWGCIAYDASSNRLYCPTGNGVPDGGCRRPAGPNGLLALDAATGAFKASSRSRARATTATATSTSTSARSPTLFDLGGRRVVGIGCKNGWYHVLDAETLAPIKWRQMLPML